MVEELFDDWRPEDATLLDTDVRKEEFEPIDVEVATSTAHDLLGIEAPDKDCYVIPLFAKDEPVPTAEYVYYRPDRGEIGWYDAGFGVDGTERFASCDRLADKEIGHRLRYWVPSNRSDVEIGVDESELPPEEIPPSDRLNQTHRDEFFDELRAFVQTERDAQRDSNWEEYEDLGLDEAIRRDEVSGPFTQIGQTTAEDRSPAFVYQMLEDEDEGWDVDLRDDEGLFEGNRCIVDTHADEDRFPVEAELLSVQDPQVEIRPVWDGIDDRAAVEKILGGESTEIWFHELLNPIPFDRRLDAIDEVEKSPTKSALLTGNRPVEYSVNEYALPSSEIELNDYQRMALVWAVCADDVACIHGPPGTGKTRTLTAYVKYAVDHGASVLVTAHSNQALDNLLVGDSTPDTPEEETLHAMAQDGESTLAIARVGTNSRNRVVQQYYGNESVATADVVAATTSGSAAFDRNDFDVAVVDEATQASRPATTIALNCAEKVVLAGDHKQLPPYCADEGMQEEDMHISLFEYLLDRYDDEISVLLRRQYRMNEEIAAFPNRAFYGGALETADRNRNWSIEDLKPLMGVDIEGDEERQDVGTSYRNLAEAEAVSKQVKLLVDHGVDPADIGVIAAYTGQVGPVKSNIHRLEISDPGAVSVDTIDSFQGGEREAIVVSFVRSNDRGQSGFLEFPDEGPRRLNVALTRARKRLVLVGNWETLGTIAPHRSPGESCANIYANLDDHLRSQERMLSR